MIVLFLACAPPPPAAPAARPGPPNVLLVSLDTVRADHTSVGGSALDTTPVLAALGQEGTVFRQAFSEANESAWSHAALFSGRYASELAAPVYATYVVPPGATLLPEALGAYGYATAAFSAGGHVTNDFGYDQGWDRWSQEPGFSSLYDTAPKALDWIARVPADKPWFVFLHGYDAHRPYSRPGPWDHLYTGGAGSRLAEAMCKNPCLSEMVLGNALFPDIVPDWIAEIGSPTVDPEHYRRLAAATEAARRVALTPADKAHIQAHYDGAVRYADTMLGLTLERLEAAGELKNTVVVVLSDHGEDLLDHGYMNHRTGLYDSCTHVPLVVSGPGFSGGGAVDALVDARDVARTVLAVAGATPPAGSGGRDLRDVKDGKGAVEAVFAEGVMDMITVRTATHRLVYHDVSLVSPDYVATLAGTPADSPHFALYDLTADPGERRDVHLEQAAETIRLRDALVAWRRGLVSGTAEIDPASVTPEVRKALQEHGYFGTEPTHVSNVSPPDVSTHVSPDVSTHVSPARGAPDQACQERFDFAPAAPP